MAWHRNPQTLTARGIALRDGFAFYYGKECRVCGSTRRHTETSCCFDCGLGKKNNLHQLQQPDHPPGPTKEQIAMKGVDYTAETYSP